ncbi:unnamed protein product [Gemmata massiliana]|uniref:Uncharacterized protein n=1 Tax=Gemmata massiliana TaxID=1210884 RepID=A0A6P2D590_9BACT|nr:hypothetical protein [Gemmata massiliana]VTR95254.1 unnamed protein product [Gemmata massiliana]
MTTFDALKWAKRFRDARTGASDELLEVIAELFVELCKVELSSADFYHRPSLVLSVHAVHQVLPEVGVLV